MSKICRKCTEKFEVVDENLEFYKKMSVPEPVFCHDCRHVKRKKCLGHEEKVYCGECYLEEVY